MPDEQPFNETKYNRIELPEELQKVFTGLLSSAGQIVVNSKLRSGEMTTPDFIMDTHDKIELKLIAIHKPVEKENDKN